ncbi:restriction endonuclease subunit S [Actinobacillus equuli subsp. haemolyticus]|uniref:restriction endonuclease subunit S n=1 Tax=Actinobacillus equuli TaxID=718 RepID=UPI0024467289|nr:restriction endonuclease subunit S [Actinobacillus equuli]WGE50185.1 restriction endonuclease subunit S [Actinobacillus equuli subsp. haemolyticus]
MAEVKMKKISMKKYEKYKQSGVQWLGEVPEHWEVKRLKFMLSEKLKYGANETAESDDQEQPRYIRITDIDEQGNLKPETFKSLELEKAKEYLLNTNDILLARSGATVGKSYIYKENLPNLACYAGYLIRARLEQDKFNAFFVNYFFQSSCYWDWIKSVNIQATIQNVSAEKYNDLALSVPSYEEQTAIADFLDNKLGEIDLLIGKQQTLLEKLAEQRTATITTTVTKGLNPNAPMKQSSVEWLGEVPEHWEVCRLKDEVTYNDETLSDKTDLDYEMLYVDISNVSLGKGIIQKEEMTFENSPTRARRIVKNGDVIISTVRTYLKAITLIENAEDNLVVSTGFAVLRPKENLLPKFLSYWVQSEKMIRAIIANSVGVSYPAINATDLVRLPIVKIPLSEQTAIANYLDKETAKIDRLCDTVNQTINRLQEYRTALITQVVTGKIKVV